VIRAVVFSPIDHDSTLFIYFSPRGCTLLLLYDDEMLTTSDDEDTFLM
jgi:hypothetical protein